MTKVTQEAHTQLLYAEAGFLFVYEYDIIVKTKVVISLIEGHHHKMAGRHPGESLLYPVSRALLVLKSQLISSWLFFYYRACIYTHEGI